MTAPVASPALQVRVVRNDEALGREVAALILAELKRKPNLLLCASAGGTPTVAYQCLAAHYEHRPKLFAKLRVIQIDEWGGLPRTTPTTCEADLRQKLLAPLHVAPNRFVGLRTDARQPAAECRRVARWLAANGPIDICILGLGLNGHVAMNEPAAAVQPRSHVARLAPNSRRHAMLKYLARKPTFGMTLGLGEILQSKRILLLVSGTKKRRALRRLLRPEVTPRFPASFLWLHGDATVFCDRQATNHS